MAKLTEKQKLFCKEYLKDFNGYRSAVAAKYSKKTAGEMAYENLKKPQIQEYIKANFSKRAKKVDICAEDILKELKTLAMHTDEIRHTDKLKALELLGKYFKMFTDKIQVEGSGEGGELVVKIIK